MIKIQIKSIWGDILFEYEKENNTIKDTVLEAIKQKADLSYADLRSADLRYANLRSAKNLFVGLACPSDGAFIGWKKIIRNAEHYVAQYLVKLEIPEDALRSSATTSKCRCNKAKVLEITNIVTGENIDSITNINEKPCVYKVGELVLPDSFDENRWNECSQGIHFFINKQEAINY